MRTVVGVFTGLLSSIALVTSVSAQTEVEPSGSGGGSGFLLSWPGLIVAVVVVAIVLVVLYRMGILFQAGGGGQVEATVRQKVVEKLKTINKLLEAARQALAAGDKEGAKSHLGNAKKIKDGELLDLLTALLGAQIGEWIKLLLRLDELIDKLIEKIEDEEDITDEDLKGLKDEIDKAEDSKKKLRDAGHVDGALDELNEVYKALKTALHRLTAGSDLAKDALEDAKAKKKALIEGTLKELLGDDFTSWYDMLYTLNDAIRRILDYLEDYDTVDLDKINKWLKEAEGKKNAKEQELKEE